MLIFPIIYLSSFIQVIKAFIQRNNQGILLYFIFGLPIYMTVLSILFNTGLKSMIIFFQPLKEITVIGLLGMGLWKLNVNFRFHFIDYLVIAYFSYTLLYVFLPVGSYDLIERLAAYKGTSFIALIYFAARFVNPTQIYISKYFHYVLVVAIAAAIFATFEFLSNQHFQSLIGYADFNYYFYNVEPKGNYGLTWTFETGNGLKRFASFFANPLEHAAATILALAVIAGLYTQNNNKFSLSPFGKIALVATLISIMLALSRSSFISYFIVIYAFAIITKKRFIIQFINTCIVSGILFLLYLLNNEDIHEFIITTLNFTNSSSIGHVLEWIEGIEAIAQNPLGMGLGESGKVGGSLGENTGGENQFLIIGVQTGIIAMTLYLAIYFALIKTAWKWFRHLKGKEKKVCLTLLLAKIGFIIPFLTSELESSAYISYMSWFLSGLFISIISRKQPDLNLNPSCQKQSQ